MRDKAVIEAGIANLERLLAKRREKPGYKENALEIEARLGELRSELEAADAE